MIIDTAPEELYELTGETSALSIEHRRPKILYLVYLSVRRDRGSAPVSSTRQRDRRLGHPLPGTRSTRYVYPPPGSRPDGSGARPQGRRAATHYSPRPDRRSRPPVAPRRTRLPRVRTRPQRPHTVPLKARGGPESAPRSRDNRAHP